MSPDIYIKQNKITVRVRNMPGNIRAVSMPFNDSYVIIVNDCLCNKERRKALTHELNHIKRNDHYNPDFLEYEE